jgi:hypothetical protein
MPVVVAFNSALTAEHTSEELLKLTSEHLVMWCKTLDEDEGPATRCYIEFQNRAMANDFLARAKEQGLVLEQTAPV